MIKAIIFDWGGVLIDDPIPGLILYCSKYLNVSEGEFKGVLRRFRPDFERGMISEDVFWERACSELGVPKPNIVRFTPLSRQKIGFFKVEFTLVDECACALDKMIDSAVSR
jgi:hypothetical protein